MSFTMKSANVFRYSVAKSQSYKHRQRKITHRRPKTTLTYVVKADTRSVIHDLVHDQVDHLIVDVAETVL